MMTVIAQVGVQRGTTNSTTEPSRFARKELFHNQLIFKTKFFFRKPRPFPLIFQSSTELLTPNYGPCRLHAGQRNRFRLKKLCVRMQKT